MASVLEGSITLQPPQYALSLKFSSTPKSHGAYVCAASGQHSYTACIMYTWSCPQQVANEGAHALVLIPVSYTYPSMP